VTDLQVRRGDTFGPRQMTFTLATGTIAGSIITFKIKKHAKDSQALLTAKTTDASPMIVIDDTTHATIEIPKEKTVLLPAGNCWWDVEILLPSGRNYTTDSGTFQVLAD
jgi:hypothetical protein